MAYSSRYLETEVFSADPVKLVCMLYRGAIDAVRAARRHLQEKDIRQRSKNIMKAYGILQELSRSLDPQYEISGNLGGLYTYMQKQLLEANGKQMEAPLEEVERLLSTLLEGWNAAVAAAPVVEESYQPVSCTY